MMSAMDQQNIERLYKEHWEKAKTLGCPLVAYSDQWYAGETGVNMVFLPGWHFQGFKHPEFDGAEPTKFSSDLSEYPKPEWFKYVAKMALYTDFSMGAGVPITYADFLSLLRANEDTMHEVSRVMYWPTARRNVYMKRRRACVRLGKNRHNCGSLLDLVC